MNTGVLTIITLGLAIATIYNIVLRDQDEKNIKYYEHIEKNKDELFDSKIKHNKHTFLSIIFFILTLVAVFLLYMQQKK